MTRPATSTTRPAPSSARTAPGFEVKWNEVDSYAHQPLLNLRRADEPESVAAPRKITRSVADGGAPELEKELLAIFERTYGAIRRRDILPMQALRSDDKRELIRALEPAEEFVLVDGYNILFAWDELKELAKSNLDAARHVLMNLLCNYQGYRGCAVILVFDAYKVPLNLGTVEKYHNILRGLHEGGRDGGQLHRARDLRAARAAQSARGDERQPRAAHHPGPRRGARLGQELPRRGVRYK